MLFIEFGSIFSTGFRWKPEPLALYWSVPDPFLLRVAGKGWQRVWLRARLIESCGYFVLKEESSIAYGSQTWYLGGEGSEKDCWTRSNVL